MPAGRPPRAVVFDVGQVLYGWDIGALYARLIPDPAERQWFLATVVTREWHAQHDAGRPFSDTSADLIAAFPDQEARIRAYGPRWLETITGPVPGVHALVEALDKAEVPLFAITNFSAEFWAIFRPTAPIFDRFRDVIVSGEERLLKPDPRIFALARRRFALGDGDALFVDDMPANVEAARAAGWHAHRFENAEALADTLRQFHLLPAAAAPVAMP